MTDEVEKKEEEFQFAPDEQSMLPGLKKFIRSKAVDYRSWFDAQGNPMDSPPYQGRKSIGGGKLILPVEEGGEPVRLGTFQIIRDVRSMLVIVDWSRPLVGELPEPDEYGKRPPAIMGKQIYRARTLVEAKSVMAALHKFTEDQKRGLPEDPEPCFDRVGSRIALGPLSLRRFARGRYVGRYALLDERQAKFPLCKISVLKELGLKDAVMVLEREHKKVASKVRPKRYVGAPISFSAPFGGGNGFVPFSERSRPESGSASWDVAVKYYARFGKYPRSADYPSGLPAGLEEEALAAREAFLGETKKEEVGDAQDSAKALEAMKKLPKKERSFLNQVLEEFDGVLLSIELPRSK